MKSNFTVILTLCILMTIGLALVPLIDVSNEPRPEQGKTLDVTFYWAGASAKVIEQNVTSKIEGLVTSVSGIDKVTSLSYFGNGKVTVELKKKADVSAVKFEIASLLRNAYKKLPKGVTYPSLTGGDVVTKENWKGTAKKLLEYQINADRSDEQIVEYVSRQIKPVLEQLNGVHHVEVIGETMKYVEITYDPNKAISSGITTVDVENAIRNYMGKKDFISDIVSMDNTRDKMRMALYLATSKDGNRLEDMPIKTVGNTVIHLNNLATFDYKHRLPDSYYRVNGMNTVYMNVYSETDASMIRTSAKVKKIIDKYNFNSKNGITFSLIYDTAEEQLRDLRELIWQSLLSLVILLTFVWFTKREWKYLLIITITLIANILIAVIAYWFFDIRLHPYSLAGITVSLGLIIDASIVMTDHYSYYHNRKSLLALTAALLTTVGALIVIFFMPDYIKHDLRDFTWVVIINLTVSLLVAMMFIPALINSLHYNSRRTGVIARKQLTLGWKRFYSEYIYFTQHHKWVYIILLVLAFGIPFHILPESVGGSSNLYYSQDEGQQDTWYESLYNNTLGSKFFQQQLKSTLSSIFGGSMKLFSDCMSDRPFAKDDKDLILHIRAQMPLGSTAAELNEKVLILERFLSKFKEIKRFETRITSQGATIDVNFTDQSKKTGFPYLLEQKIIGKVITIGGADWSTYGIRERGFSNSLNLQYRANNIEIAGYDYDRLYRFAENIADKIHKNNRVEDIVIETPGHEFQEDEYYMRYDMQRLALYNISLFQVYKSLQGFIDQNNIGKYDDGTLAADVELKSAMRDRFNLWQLQNSYIKVDTADVRLSNFMEITRREAKNCIPKQNQEYVLRVAFNILGSYSYTDKYIKEVTKEFNAKFPVGFKCLNKTSGWYEDTGSQYWLILLVILVIFFICSILFESLTLPLVIISNIPVSLIGTFLIFRITGVEFGSGGFASIVLLCGVVVNSGIYILEEYRNVSDEAVTKGFKINRLNLYLKAYNHKIMSVFLTTLSTVMGLLPFLIHADHQQFWFSFAIGSLGGLLFSIIALVFIMPIFMKLTK